METATQTVTNIELVVGAVTTADQASAVIQSIVDAKKRVQDAKATLDRAKSDYAAVEKQSTDLLRVYFDTVGHEYTGNSERVRLPGGTLVLKSQDDQIVVDDATVIAWAESNGMGQYIKKSLDWAGLKSQLEIVGDHMQDVLGNPIPGITLTPRGKKFSIESIKEVK